MHFSSSDQASFDSAPIQRFHDKITVTGRHARVYAILNN